MHSAQNFGADVFVTPPLLEISAIGVRNSAIRVGKSAGHFLLHAVAFVFYMRWHVFFLHAVTVDYFTCA